MNYKDDRLKMMNEILNGIKVLKLYAWEPSMEKIIRNLRHLEMCQLKYQYYIGIITDLCYYCTPLFVSVFTSIIVEYYYIFMLQLVHLLHLLSFNHKHLHHRLHLSH